MISKKFLIFTYLIIYSLITIYCLLIIYNTSFIGITLHESENKWVVSDIRYNKWANKHGLNIGDFIISIDDNPIEKSLILSDDYIIRSAEKIEFLDTKSLEKKTIDDIDIFDLDDQLLMHLILPSIYFLLALSVSIKLLKVKKFSNTLKLLNLFILSVSLAYVSSGASSRHDSLGLMINGCSLILSAIFLLHFTESYIRNFHSTPSNKKRIRILYCTIPIIMYINFYVYFNPNFMRVRNIITLIVFLLIFLLIICYLMVGFIKFKSFRIKIIILSIILPFFPFIFLYLLPQLLFKQYLIEPDLTVSFLLLLPYFILFTQLIDHLFELQYFVSRLLSYLNYSLFFTVWNTIFIYTFIKVELTILFKISTFVFFSVILLFYIKEKIDFSQRKILLSKKGDYVHKLYNCIEILNKKIEFNSILEHLKYVISNEFLADSVLIGQYSEATGCLTLSEDSNIVKEGLKNLSFDKITIGQVKKIKNLYVCCIYNDGRGKYFFILSYGKKSKLQKEELLLLELLTIYIENLLHSSRTIEELIEELNKKENLIEPKAKFLSKLLFVRFENEKQILAQDLHDNVLQDLIYISRNINLISNNSKFTELKLVQGNVMKTINDLRNYCEELKPPLLEALGLDAALHNLILKYQRISEFRIISTLDRIYLSRVEEEILIYRIFQELLSNALKHSNANKVELKLNMTSNGIMIEYLDDGIGFDINQVISSTTMGIKGLNDKVDIMGGTINIYSEPQKGVNILIEKLEGDNND